MRSLGRTTSGAVNGVKETVSEYRGWLILGGAAFVLWKFNGVFGSLGDTLTLGVDAATAEMKAKAEAAAAAEKVKSNAALAKVKVSVAAPGATPAQIAQFQADAETIAAALGTQKGVYTRQWLFSDASTAFNVVKLRYSRLLLHNNKPYNQSTLVVQNEEAPTSAKRKVNHAALQPFYSDVTGGRNLVADMKDACSASKYQPVLRWIL